MERMVLPILEQGGFFCKEQGAFVLNLSSGLTRTTLKALAQMGASGAQKYNPIVADLQRTVNIERRMQLLALVPERVSTE